MQTLVKTNNYKVLCIVCQDRQLGNCEASNPLTYFSKYTYPACRVEQKLTHAATRCKCKPFMLPKAVNTNGKCKIRNFLMTERNKEIHLNFLESFLIFLHLLLTKFCLH